jgi:hypothetical protein
LGAIKIGIPPTQGIALQKRRIVLAQLRVIKVVIPEKLLAND